MPSAPHAAYHRARMNSLHESVATALRLVLGADATLLSIVARSLAVSGAACVIACSLGDRKSVV